MSSGSLLEICLAGFVDTLYGDLPYLVGCREGHLACRAWSMLTLSPPILLRLYTLPYWSNAPFLIFDIQALWRSGLPECQKIKMVA